MTVHHLYSYMVTLYTICSNIVTQHVHALPHIVTLHTNYIVYCYTCMQWHYTMHSNKWMYKAPIYIHIAIYIYAFMYAHFYYLLWDHFKIGAKISWLVEGFGSDGHSHIAIASIYECYNRVFCWSDLAS